MKKFLIFVLSIASYSAFGQQLGEVQKGMHSLKLHKSENKYAITYSDVMNKEIVEEHSFNFPYHNTVYNLIMYGFNKQTEHQLIIQTSTDTIIRFEYKKIFGDWMLKIKQNNLNNSKQTSSTFFTKNDIIALFDKPSALF